MDTTRELKAKLNALSASTREYRKGIQKCGKGISWGVRNGKEVTIDTEQLGNLQHTKSLLKKQARCTHLCIGFLKGKVYKSMEEHCYTGPDITLMADTIAKVRYLSAPGRNTKSIRFSLFQNLYYEAKKEVEAWLSAS